MDLSLYTAIDDMALSAVLHPAEMKVQQKVRRYKCMLNLNHRNNVYTSFIGSSNLCSFVLKALLTQKHKFLKQVIQPLLILTRKILHRDNIVNKR